MQISRTCEGCLPWRPTGKPKEDGSKGTGQEDVPVGGGGHRGELGQFDGVVEAHAPATAELRLDLFGTDGPLGRVVEPVGALPGRREHELPAFAHPLREPQQSDGVTVVASPLGQPGQPLQGDRHHEPMVEPDEAPDAVDEHLPGSVPMVERQLHPAEHAQSDVLEPAVLYFFCYFESLVDQGERVIGLGFFQSREPQVDQRQQRMAAVPEGSGLMVVVEGMYSVDSSVAPLDELLDAVHGVGVLGETGRGAGEALGCLDRIDLLTLTFSKSLASCGGAILGPTDVVEEIRHKADSYLFMASNVPAAVAASLEALRVVRETPELPDRVRHNGELLRAAVTEAGWPVTDGQGPIVSVSLPNPFHAVGAWRIMLELGAYCNVQIPPAVPKGRASLRLSAMATHTAEQIDRLHDIVVEVQKVIRSLRSSS